MAVMINVNKTTPAIASLTLPNSLLYSGEIRSISFSKPLLNNSSITTKKQTIIIVIRYTVEIFNKSAMKIKKPPMKSCIFMFLSLDMPLNKPLIAQNALSLKFIFVTQKIWLNCL